MPSAGALRRARDVADSHGSDEGLDGFLEGGVDPHILFQFGLGGLVAGVHHLDGGRFPLAGFSHGEVSCVWPRRGYLTVGKAGTLSGANTRQRVRCRAIC